MGRGRLLWAWATSCWTQLICPSMKELYPLISMLTTVKCTDLAIDTLPSTIWNCTRSDASSMYHVRTAPSVTVPSLLPARAHGTISRSAYATLGYRSFNEHLKTYLFSVSF